MIGLMVGLLLAGLLGWYFISRRTGGNLTTTTPATAPTAVSPPPFDPTNTSQTSQIVSAINADVDPFTQTALNDINESGSSNQSHLAQSFTGQQIETAAILNAAAANIAANGGNLNKASLTALAGSTINLTAPQTAGIVAVLNAGPPAGGTPQPPGTYWDYSQQKWVPLLA